MKTNYTIDEILVTVDKIQNIKRERHRNINQRKSSKIDNSNIPFATLKLIEEAGKN